MYIYKYSRFWKFASPLRPFSDEKPARVKSTSTLSTRLHPRTRQNSWKKKERKKGKKKRTEKMKKKNKKKRRNVEKKWNETSTFHPPCRRSPLLFQYPWMAALSNIECQYLRASWPARLFHVENVFFFPLSSLFFFMAKRETKGGA